MASAPPTQYASDGERNVAYQVSGEGTADLLYVPTAINPIDLMWDEPVISRGLRRLAAHHRVITCDLVGVGSSDPVFFGEMPAMQVWADGIGAVLDAVGSERACILGMAESCLPVLLYAASHPERVQSLVLWAPFARYERAPDHECGMPSDALDVYLDGFREIVGTGDIVELLAPSRWTTHGFGSGGRAVSASLRDAPTSDASWSCSSALMSARRSRAFRRRPSWCAG